MKKDLERFQKLDLNKLQMTEKEQEDEEEEGRTSLPGATQMGAAVRARAFRVTPLGRSEPTGSENSRCAGMLRSLRDPQDARLSQSSAALLPIESLATRNSAPQPPTSLSLHFP